MVSVNNVSVLFGSFVLLDEVSFLITRQERIGLTGKNGAGKSTLMKIIAGLQQPTSGSIEGPREMTVGYLEQQMKISDSTTVLDETLTAFAELQSLEAEVEQCNREVEERTDYESASYRELLERLHHAGERYRMLGGNDFTALAEQTLTGLGFSRKGFSRPTRELSGGWRMRVELAKILLRKPDLILLDEPTNHLDIESIIWLEGFLSTYPGAVLLVSHDRTFLDNVTKRTIEISLGKIYDYRVPYTKYTVLRKERRGQQEAAFRNQQKMIEDTEKFIERFRYKPTKAVQVQSKIKQLKKIERIEIEDEDLSSINIRFAPAPRSGTVVVEADEVTKRYGKHLVLDKITLKIERGEKVAFVGRNGEGKTTLTRIILGQLEHEGLMKKGHNVNIGYFAQNQDELLNDEMTVFETVDYIARGDIRTRLRDILGAFLFGGENIDKKVKVLSGGERSRLAIVQLLLEPFNLLLLDEPTNHLDIRSKEILKKALLKFDGTLIVVSHDRDFLDGLVTKVFEFRNRKIKTHLGGISDFLAARKIESLKELEKKDTAVVKGGKYPPASSGIASEAKGTDGARATKSPGAAGARGHSGLRAAKSPGATETRGHGGARAANSPGAAGMKTAGARGTDGAQAVRSSGAVWPAKKTDSAALKQTDAVPDESKEAIPDSKMRYLGKKENERVYRRLTKQVEESEASIASLEKEIAGMDSKLASGDPEVVSNASFYRDYEKKKQELDSMLTQWEQAHNELEEFTADYMKKDDNI